jgi:pimeloyl-ACP methyl ester carboxylesterase
MPAFGSARLFGFIEGRPDERPPLVLLHGLTFDHRMWLPAVDALRRRDPDRQVLVLDLPGHGGSPLLPRCDVEHVAGAVASAAEDAGLDRPVLVGHSISGVIATVYAVLHPARGVVNVDQVVDATSLDLARANRDAVTGPGFTELWPAILASMRIDLLPREARVLLSTELPRQDIVLAYWGQALETPRADMEAMIAQKMAALRDRRLPYLIVAGHEYDPSYTRWLADALPQARVVVFPDSGHFPHLADPDRFAGLLAETGRWSGSHRRDAVLAPRPISQGGCAP